MKLFSCSACHTLVFFDNNRCTACSSELLYLPRRARIVAVEPLANAAGEPLYRALGGDDFGTLRKCRNAIEYNACCWATDASSDEYCPACVLNDTVPDLSDDVAKASWLRIEAAKRRLMYSLLALELPVEPKRTPDGPGLAFSFLRDQADQKVFTGHSNGLIVINIAEADAPFREKVRVSMNETYRTLLGHFRHEIGHYYWDRLVKDGPRLQSFRELFGDEQLDYAEAQQRHYGGGAPGGWQAQFVSAYASMHPWEDFAETWAHYLHMADTLETARSYGLALRAKAVGGATETPMVRATRLDFDDFDDLIGAWIPLTIALNSLNRSMGLPDLYPFVLSETGIRKLRFVHDLIEAPGS